MDPTHTCPCQHCGQPLAFPPEMLRQEAGCPHCGAATLLHDPAAVAPVIEAVTEAATERAWFYNLAGETHGPLAESAVAAMFATGQLSAETWVWSEGEADWRPSNEIACFQLAPPPIPPKIPPKLPSKSIGASGGLGQIAARSSRGTAQFRPTSSSTSSVSSMDSSTRSAPISTKEPRSSFKPTGASAGSGGGGGFSRFSGGKMLKIAGSTLVVLFVAGSIAMKVVWKTGVLANVPVLGKIFGGGTSLRDEVQSYLTFRDQQINAMNQVTSTMPGGAFTPPAALAATLERSVIPVFETSLRAYQNYPVKDAELLAVKQIEATIAQQRIQAYKALVEACKQQDRQQIQSAQRNLKQTEQREREVQNKLREIGSKAGVNIMFRPF